MAKADYPLSFVPGYVFLKSAHQLVKAGNPFLPSALLALGYEAMSDIPALSFVLYGYPKDTVGSVLLAGFGAFYYSSSKLLSALGFQGP